MHQHSIGKRRRWRARTVSVAAGIVLLAAGMVSFAAVSPADGAPPPTLTVTGVPVSIPESSAFSGPVATFIDSDPSLPASDFTATIAWGDGTTTPGAIAGSSGNFTVTGTHTYADEGSFAVGVTVTDTVNSVTGSASPTATVSEIDNLTAGSPITFSATQGTSFTGPVATFTDTAYPTNLASDFTATIAWGDGTTTPGTIAGGSGTFTVSGTHAYAVPGTFNLSVTIQDDAPGISAATVAAVANVVPILVVTGVPVSIPESSAFSGPVATFTAADPTKPASDFTATIAWGDGTTTPGTIAGSSGSFTVTGTHAYADEGSFPLGVTVTDTVSSVTGSASPTATVSELDNLAAGSPITFSATQGTSFSGPVATFTDSANPTNVASDFTATIAWGDGTTSVGTISGAGGTFTVSGTHTYTGSGPFNLSVGIHDDAPGTSAATVAGVANVARTLAVTGVPVSIPESSAFSGPVATFTDTDPSKPASDFTATIAWGDGTTTTGAIAGGVGSFTVTGAHAYADEGSFALGVTVTDTVSTATSSVSPTATVSEIDNLTAGSPITFSATQGTSFTGPVATFTNSAYPTNLASDFTATIAWGDGTNSPGTISAAGGTLTVSGTHTYTGAGTSGVTVTLADGPPGTDSAVAHATAAVTATTPATTPPTSPASPPQSGAGVATTRPSTTNGGALAFTGASVLGSSLLGALLVLLGASLVVITRRRSRPS